MSCFQVNLIFLFSYVSYHVHELFYVDKIPSSDVSFNIILIILFHLKSNINVRICACVNNKDTGETLKYIAFEDKFIETQVENTEFVRNDWEIFLCIESCLRIVLL